MLFVSCPASRRPYVAEPYTVTPVVTSDAWGDVTSRPKRESLSFKGAGRVPAPLDHATCFQVNKPRIVVNGVLLLHHHNIMVASEGYHCLYHRQD